METDIKNPDSANESVESFEDAIDHLEISDDPKNSSKPEDHKQPIGLTSDHTANKTDAPATSQNTDPMTAPLIESNSSVEDVTTVPPDMVQTETAVKKSDDVLATSSPHSNDTSSGIEVKSLVKDVKLSSASDKIPNQTPISQEKEAVQTSVENITSNLTAIAISETKPENPSVSPKVENQPLSTEASDSKLKQVDEGPIKVNTERNQIESIPDVVVPTSVASEESSPKVSTKEVIAEDSVKESLNDTKIANSTTQVVPTEVADETVPNELVKEVQPGEPVIQEIPKESNKGEIAIDASVELDNNVTSDTNEGETRLVDKDGSIEHKSEEELNEDEGSIKSEERECGDGQGEQDDVEKELDHDEDKRNPEYIPKKGSFYEHDTRTMDGFDDDVKKIEEETAAKSKKKAKPVVEGRWAHDKFDELEQCPKSQQEIIDTYGYDIRNEEHAPKARRNRRYGRGPNKYNRNWEDEKAYIKIENKPRPPGRGPRQNSDRNRSDNETRQPVEREEFPPLSRVENHLEKRSPKPSAVKQPSDGDKPGGIHYSDKIGMKAEKGAWVPPPPFSQKNVINKNNAGNESKTNNSFPSHTSNASHKEQPQSNDKSSPPKPKAFAPLNNAPFSPTSPSRGSNRPDKTSPPKPKAFAPLNNAPFSPTSPPRGSFRPSSQANNNFLSHRNDIYPNGAKAPRSKLPESGLIRPRANWEPNNWYINQNKIETAGPPELVDPSSKIPAPGPVASLRGGKRYSVQRQQSLPEAARVTNAYGKESPVPPSDESVGVEGTPVPTAGLTAYYHHPVGANAPPITVPQTSPSHLVFTQSPPPPTPAAPIIKGDYVNLNLAGETPIYHSNSFQPAPVYSESNLPISNGGAGAPPMLLPVHFVSPPPPQVPAFSNNQAPIMSYGPQPMQFQPMQPIVNLPPPPQAEVFQPAGGITYYSPQTQAVLQRPALSKRVKSAIPIVPPNEINSLLQQTAALQNNLIQQKNNLMQQQQQVQLVPVDINKDESLSN